jgi:hypothetical protein
MTKGVGTSRAKALITALAVFVLTGSLGGTSVSAQTSGCLPTSERTIGPHGFPGLGIKRPAVVFTDPFQWASTYRKSTAVQQEAGVLRSEGFISGTFQLYFGKKRKTRGDHAVSTAVQFGSPDGMQADFNRIYQEIVGDGRWKHFSAAAIPGSRGLYIKAGGSGASNLWFADGTYFYVVGRYVSRGGTARKAVVKAAVDLYNRVHGSAACG